MVVIHPPHGETVIVIITATTDIQIVLVTAVAYIQTNLGKD
jgi:hypothetical protein